MAEGEWERQGGWSLRQGRLRLCVRCPSINLSKKQKTKKVTVVSGTATRPPPSRVNTPPPRSPPPHRPLTWTVAMAPPSPPRPPPYPTPHEATQVYTTLTWSMADKY
jgi:hypothetical protein